MTDISEKDPMPRQTGQVLDSHMAYVETGKNSAGAPAVVFLHGNPTSSYLWRNIIPHVEPHARCLAPDLIGMGRSGKSGNGSYRFVDHARYLDAWFDAVVPDGPVFLVIHDWGCALGIYWARRNEARIAGIAYMEGVVAPRTWDEWPENARKIFEGFRSEAGEEMVLEKNVFIEKVLPASVIREIGEDAMNVYRAPFKKPGEGRRPMLTWPREIPIEGDPADVARIVSDNRAWCETSDTPKLLVNAEPGSILKGKQLEICRGFKNQEEVSVPGIHFIQEDSPHEIGNAVAAFVQRVGE